MCGVESVYGYVSYQPSYKLNYMLEWQDQITHQDRNASFATLRELVKFCEMYSILPREKKRTRGSHKKTAR